MLYPINKPFDSVSQLVDGFIKWPGSGFVDPAGNRQMDIVIMKVLTDLSTAIGLISNQPVRSDPGATSALPFDGPCLHDPVKCGSLVPLTGSQHKGDQLACSIGSQMDLGGEPSLAVAKRFLFRVPLFNPAACWWARMIVLSIKWISQSTAPLASAVAWSFERI